MKETNKQTAVEWLVERLEKHHTSIDIKNTIAFQQAKEMEKKQIMKAFSYGDESGCECYSFSNPDDAEQYYNETYESKTNL